MMRNIRYINAGAGSGKTYTLTDIFSNLIAEGKTTPARVILTTFTERAAAEFRLKTRAMLIERGLHERAAELDSALIGTVHSVAFRYITKYWYLLGLSADVQPMPEEDTERYIAATLAGVANPEDLKVFGDYVETADIKGAMSTRREYDFWKADVKALIEKAETFNVESLTPSLEASRKLFDEIFAGAAAGDAVHALQKDVMERIYRIAGDWRAEFERYKKEHDLVSFNDMERLFFRLLSFPQVRDDIRESVDYVFVDEFQDSNPMQVRIFEALSEIVGKGSYWVGDPKQAIYDFRGCDTALTTAVTSVIEGNAKAGKPGFEYGVLPHSYRSDPYLVELVNKAFVPVFRGQLTEDKVKLIPKRKSLLPSSPRPSIHWDLQGQMPEGGSRLSYKKEYLYMAIAAQVSNIVAGTGRIAQVVDKETGELRSIRPDDIAILCRKGDDCEMAASFLRKLGLPVTRESEGSTEYREVALLLAVLNYFLGDTNLLDAELAYLIEDAGVEMILQERDGLREMPVFPRLDAMRERLRGCPVSYIVSSVINELDLNNMVYKWEDPDIRLRVLESVKQMAVAYESQCLHKSAAATLGGFIHFLGTNPIPVGRDIQAGGVNVLTYHASKGLEWPVVILCSLGTDELNLQDFLKRNYIGVNESRLSAPTPERLYSEYIVRYIPRYLSSSRSSLPADVVDALTAQPDYREKLAQVRSQAARLLYVGATRARDYLITAASKSSGTKWLQTLGIEPACDYKSPEGDYCVWGPQAPLSFMEHIGLEGSPQVNKRDEYCTLAPRMVEEPGYPKYRRPSGEQDTDSLPEAASFVQAWPAPGEEGQRISVTGTIPAYDLFGTCIHNIFASYRPGEDGWNYEMAGRTLRRYALQETLPAPSEIIRAADNLFAFREGTYGKAVAVYHELPFSYLDEATREVISGEMDLVWETAEGVALVDFKNYPGFDDVLNPSSKFYAGKYLRQMFHYGNALSLAGKRVLDRLIYYAVQGRIVKLEGF